MKNHGDEVARIILLHVTQREEPPTLREDFKHVRVVGFHEKHGILIRKYILVATRHSRIIMICEYLFHNEYLL